VLAEKLAKGISNVIGIRSDLGQMAEVPGLLWELRKLSDAWPDDASLIRQKAVASSNAIIGYCTLEQMDESERLLAELERLQRSQPTVAVIPELHAMALARTLAAYVNLNQIADVERILRLLLRLQESHLNATTAAWTAEALANALLAYANSTNVLRTRALLNKLRGLYRAFSKNPQIVTTWATGLANAVNGYHNARDIAKMESVLDELTRLLDSWPERTVASPLAHALFIAMYAYINSEQSKKVETLRSRILELEKRFPGLEVSRDPRSVERTKFAAWGAS
jgi:hypothetical protein